MALFDSLTRRFMFMKNPKPRLASSQRDKHPAPGVASIVDLVLTVRCCCTIFFE
jgi:hypothetical protein